jgi:hypothetical protein
VYLSIDQPEYERDGRVMIGGIEEINIFYIRIYIYICKLYQYMYVYLFIDQPDYERGGRGDDRGDRGNRDRDEYDRIPRGNQYNNDYPQVNTAQQQAQQALTGNE